MILEELSDSTFRLNQIYRTLLVYTGATPDQYRDYKVDQVYPEIMEAMSLESKRLYKIVDEVVETTGQKADKIASAQTLAQQLERFCEKPEKITLEFTTFKENISALGSAILSMSETKLDIDYIAVYGENAKLDKDKSNFFKKAAHERSEEHTSELQSPSSISYAVFCLVSCSKCTCAKGQLGSGIRL